LQNFWKSIMGRFLDDVQNTKENEKKHSKPEKISDEDQELNRTI